MRAPRLPRQAKVKQHGAALMIMIVIMVVGVAAVLIGALSFSALKSARQERTSTALAQAKEALLGYTASDTNRPGELPCPDVDGDGMLTMNVDYGPGTLCKKFVGYLPWKTLGLSELRDGDNEKLWYALSVDFYAGNSATLNSDTQGQLSITGNITMSNVAAIVFAPGTPLTGQSRSASPNALCTTTGTTIAPNLCASNYLEGDNANTDTVFVLNSTTDTFNDNLLAITASQVFQLVERRVGREIRQILKTYYTAWGAFPFAAPFADPSTSNFTGQSSPVTYYGLLPAGISVLPTWAGIPTVSFSGSGSYNYCQLRNGSVANSILRCKDIVISAGETITITGTLNDVGRGFWRPHNINSLSEVYAINAVGTTVLATSVLNNLSVTGSLNSDGSATVVFSANGKSGYPTLQRIELGDIQNYTLAISPATSPVIPAWLPGNNWRQVAYYAVSPGYAPGNSACNPLPGTPSCLTVNGSGGGSNKRAVVMMTGGALTGQSHPSGTLANYLEGENATPADFIYENNNRSSTFNDQMIIVAP